MRVWGVRGGGSKFVMKVDASQYHLLSGVSSICQYNLHLFFWDGEGVIAVRGDRWIERCSWITHTNQKQVRTTPSTHTTLQNTIVRQLFWGTIV